MAAAKNIYVCYIEVMTARTGESVRDLYWFRLDGTIEHVDHWGRQIQLIPAHRDAERETASDVLVRAFEWVSRDPDGPRGPVLHIEEVHVS